MLHAYHNTHCTDTDSVFVTKDNLLKYSLTPEDARRLARELYDAAGEAELAEEERSTSYVQVKFLGGGTLARYTYRDPSGSLEIGDLVEVPTSRGPATAKVKELGRGSYVGPVKDVTALLVPVAL